ncbi:MAG TPA: alpha-ketoglutarate-dependent dioxygenase AlkB [Cyanobacteria bacterium UBA11372]|nr:alpha-ketoglutarate-dependent dioxygenase AlkB [Cyanobacteria bacterium UBA11372]
MLSADAKELDLATLLADTANIPGLTYIPEYINPSQAEQLLLIIDQQIWSSQLKRSVQHYGYKYDYKKRLVDPSMNLGALPNWAQDLAQRFYLEGLTEKIPDQVIVNEYQPGQGIANHIDCVPCFGNTIISLSLGGTCVMEFTRVKTKEKIPVLLLPRSIIILQGAARYEWQHGIAARKTDKYYGREFVRDRRVSLTFRKVLLSEKYK